MNFSVWDAAAMAQHICSRVGSSVGNPAGDENNVFAREGNDIADVVAAVLQLAEAAVCLFVGYD